MALSKMCGTCKKKPCERNSLVLLVVREMKNIEAKTFVKKSKQKWCSTGNLRFFILESVENITPDLHSDP